MKPKEMHEFYRSKGLSENFCPVPFTTLIFEANGNVCMCRRKGAEFSIGDIRSQSIEEIWNGETLRSIREEFLTGNVTTCAKEIARDRCNISPGHSNLFEGLELKAHQTRPPIRITPNFNGRCNLECPMCHIWQFPNGLYDEVGIWQKLETDILPHLVEIDTFSGEPFVQKDTYRLIEMAARINPLIEWSFTTNGNWKFNSHVRTHLDKIRIKEMIFSIDSLDPERYAKIRKNGRLDLALKTFDDLIEYEKERLDSGKSPVGMSIMYTVQKENWMDVPTILEFIKLKNARISFRCLIEPPWLSLLDLPRAERVRIAEFYLREIPARDLIHVSRIFSVLFEDLEPLDKAPLLLELKNRLAESSAR
jgi:radical SAM protein with 4Fe4S-binding SPASM domain